MGKSDARLQTDYSNMSLEDKLGVALSAVTELGPKLEHEQNSRRITVIVVVVAFVGAIALAATLYFESRAKTDDLEDALSAVEATNAELHEALDSMCAASKGNREFSVAAARAQQEALITASANPDEPRTPEEQKRYEEAIVLFRKSLQDQIDLLPPLQCEVSSG